MNLVTAARRITSAGSPLLLGVALTVALGASSAASRVSPREEAPQGPAVNGISPEAMAQIEALMREKETRSPAEQKIDSQLLYALRMQRGLPVAPGVQTLEVDVPRAADGHVIVDVTGSVTAALMAQLDALTSEGAVRTSPASVQMHVDLDQVEEIAAQPGVVFVQPRQAPYTSGIGKRSGAARVSASEGSGAGGPTAGMVPGGAGDAVGDVQRMANDIGTGQGSVASQADITHRSAVFRGLTGFNGAGVKIGVLADGVAHLAAAQASGNLGPVTVLPGQAGPVDADEGTSMLEVIHDVAPGAQLYFATGFTGITSLAQNIRDLRTAGCDIIVDNIGYFPETPFQDGQGPSVVSPTNGGVVIQAVKDVAAAGALYFSAAGNSGNLNDGTSGVWEGDYVLGAATGAPIPAGSAGNFHRFTGVQDFNTLTVAGSGPITLQWSDPLGSSGNDYDLFRLNTAGDTVASSSTNIQDGNDDPYEQMSNSTASPRIVVVKKTGAAARFLHLNTNRGQLSVATAGQTHGHNATSNAYTFGVAATYAGSAYPNPFSTSNVVETFSSDGPRRIFFLGDGTAITPGNFSSTGGAVLQKPDLTAADGVFVSGAGDQPGQYFGTAAAAANAAAIAALIKSANPGFTQGQLRSALLSSALDIEAPGVDRDSGVGIVMAAAPQPVCTFTLAPPLPPTVGTAGGGGAVSVTASSGGCNWVVFSNVPWITVSGSGVGTGNASVGYSVAANPGPARSGTIMIQGGQVITVTQAGTPATSYDSAGTLFIADNATQESSINVSGITGTISNVTVSFYLTHTFDADLTITLIGPDGTTADLSVENGGSANNYGSACSPLSSRTTFDDSAPTYIAHGSAPFVGSFRPEQPLSTFYGKYLGTANGAWKLRIKDSFAGDTGTLMCWSLNINQVPFPDLPNVGVYRPSTGRWFFPGQPAIDYGLAGDLPVPGDYNGDGIRDVAVFRPSNGTWYVSGGITAVWGAPGDIPVPADYNGDHITDMAVFRPSTGIFYVRDVGNFSWGLAGDLPVVGDYNGDGLADVAVYRPSNGTWYVRNVMTAVYGFAADIPVPADYDGNGVTDIAVFRPATGTWFIKDQYSQSWGLPGDVPVPMDRDGDAHAELGVFRRSTGVWIFKNHVTDSVELGLWGAAGDIPLGRSLPVVQTPWGTYDGDRKADLTVYRPSTGEWVSLRSLSGMTDYTVRNWGLSTDVPVGRDYDGDGKIDPAVYRPSVGRWLVLQSSTNYTTYVSQDWGLSSDTPVPADYDGDGKTDFAVYRPSLGRWVILLSSNNATAQYDWGVSTDVVVPADYDGDGVADLAVFRPSTGRWFIYNRMTGATATQDWGLSGDVPSAADFDGDGKADLAVFRPSTGRWFIRSSIDASYTIADWGLSGDYVVPADYDGDGKADIAVFRPSTGTWYVRGLFNRSWGLSTDIPVLKNP
jgi:subtilisin-like proprotein convertase family protein